MTREIEKKIRDGEGITDSELDTALEFYQGMESGLRLLGPHFHLAWCDVQRVYYQLVSYKRERSRREERRIL